jgi:hypothetical protein
LFISEHASHSCMRYYTPVNLASMYFLKVNYQ